MRALSLLIAFVMGCSGSEDASVPADWLPVMASCGYAFMAPPTLVVEEAQGVDSCVDVWSTGSCRLIGDRGAFSGPDIETEELFDFQQSSETINGRPAQITTAQLRTVPAEAPFLSSVYFDLPDPDGPDSLFDTSVKVSAYCATPGERDETLLVLRSITILDAAG